MAKRKVDKLAGSGSFMDKLRKRRRAMEMGDASGGQAFRKKKAAKKKKKAVKRMR